MMHLEHAAIVVRHATGPSAIVIVQPGHVHHGVQGTHRHGANRPGVEGALQGGSLSTETGHGRPPCAAATATDAVIAAVPSLAAAAALVCKTDAASSAFASALAVCIAAAEGEGAGAAVCCCFCLRGRFRICRHVMARMQLD